MIICNNCKSQQLDGSIFCADCGASMVPARRHETTASLGQGLAVEIPATPVTIPAPPPSEPSGPQLTFVVMNSGRRLTLDVQDDLLIGRKDEARGIFPDVDLGNDGGYDSGVSRRHAILSFKDGVFRIEDLNSANGTFINGRKLAPQAPTALTHGDELKCAMLLIRVEVG